MLQPPKTAYCVLVFAIFANAIFADAADTKNKWSVGVARVNITPKESIWMGGYASRTRPGEGILTELWAKAIVMDDGHGNRATLITADLVAIDRKLSLSVRNAIQKKYGIPLRSVALNVSHTHSGPVVGQSLAPQQRMDAQQSTKVQRYAERLRDSLVDVVGQAIDRVKPCQLSWGVGKCTFAVNRRENKEADVPRLRSENKLQGPVDHAVPVLRVTDESNRMIAVVFGYACHATVTQFYEWSGDYPGFAQIELERSFPDTVAMFWAGCGADQNPLPRRKLDLAKSYGKRLADSVERVLDGQLELISGTLSTAYEEVPLAFGQGPTLDEIRAMQASKKQKTANWAALLLARWQADNSFSEEYPYPVQLWQIGNGPKMIFLGGEVVVDYSLRLKSEFDDKGTWVAGYTNDVMNYIPSRRVFLEGGYEGTGGMYSYAQHAPWTPQVEATIVAAVHRLAAQSSESNHEGKRDLVYVGVNEQTSRSAAVVVRDQPLAHTSLLLPLDESGKIVGDDTRAQTQQVIQELKKVLATAQGDLRRLVKLNVYAESPAVVKMVEQELATLLPQGFQPAATFVAGDLPRKGALLGVDAVAVSSLRAEDQVRILTVPNVFAEAGQSHVAVMPNGEKIYLSGWIDRGKGELDTVVDATLAFQVKLLERLGGSLENVVRIRAFLNMREQREAVRDSVTRLFADQDAVPPVVYAPWGRPGAPEIEFIVAGRPQPPNPPTSRVVEYFNTPDRPASPVFSRATRIHSDKLIFVSGMVARRDGDAESQIRDIFEQLSATLKLAGSDLRHMAKATYYQGNRDAAKALSQVRREIYDPKRAPAASGFVAQHIGYENRAANIDMLAIPSSN